MLENYDERHFNKIFSFIIFLETCPNKSGHQSEFFEIIKDV